MLNASALALTQYFSGLVIVDVSPMMGGLSQRLYLVTYQSNQITAQCVVRSIRDSLLARQEYALMRHAGKLSANLSALESITIDGQLLNLIIMDYIDGSLAKDIPLSSYHLNTIARQLSLLHQSLPSAPIQRPSVNKLSLIDDYWTLITDATIEDKIRYQRCYALLRNLSFDNTALIHGDLNLSNLIVTSDKVVWLDWEYASVGDAYFDYAAFIVECDQNIEYPFIGYLESYNSAVIDLERLSYFKLYYALISWLWCVGLAESKTPQLSAALNKYRDEVDQLVAVIVSNDISL